MSLRSEIDTRIKAAMRSHDDKTRDLLKVVLGEVQLQESRTGKPASDEDVQKILRKMVEGLKEMMEAKVKQGIGGDRPEEGEIAILDGFLPKQADKATIIGVANTVLADVKAAKSDGAATGVLMKVLKAAGISANGKDVGEVAKELRTA